MLATIASATLLGVNGLPVAVQVHVTKGMPTLRIVGLPDTTVRESRDRVRAALESSGVTWPQKKITVNLAPSGLRKIGSGLDLPIAVGVLSAAGVIPPESPEGLAFLGELGLDGSVRAIPGVVSLVDAVAERAVVVPAAVAREAGLLGRHRVHPIATCAELIEVFRDVAPWPDPKTASTSTSTECCRAEGDGAAPIADDAWRPDLADVRGQPVARFAIEVAAAGGHHVLLVGPPGAGKTMLARRLPGLLPPLTPDDALETTRIHSAAGLRLPPTGLVDHPPFRAPHHGSSAVSIVGGGSASLRPGEISNANHGVLFLDEMGEFSPRVLDSLRQPLEEGVIRVARASVRTSLPARFLLVGAMNPCPCGDGGPPGSCRCTDAARQRYRRRLSGPLLDRFDLRVEVTRPDPDELLGAGAGEPSSVVADRVAAARARARQRGVRGNVELRDDMLDRFAPLSPVAIELLQFQLRTGALSARGLVRVRAVARTIADLQGADDVVEAEHISLALTLRTSLFPAEYAVAG